MNKELGGARYHVEIAFGILKARFRIFHPLECAAENIRFAIILICTIFVLHNFLVDIQDNSREWLAEELQINDEVDGVNEVVPDLDTMTRKALIRHMRWKLEN